MILTTPLPDAPLKLHAVSPTRVDVDVAADNAIAMTDQALPPDDTLPSMLLSDFHPVASALVLPSRIAPLARPSPRFLPTTVTLLDPVDPAFEAITELVVDAIVLKLTADTSVATPFATTLPPDTATALCAPVAVPGDTLAVTSVSARHVVVCAPVLPTRTCLLASHGPSPVPTTVTDTPPVVAAFVPRTLLAPDLSVVTLAARVVVA